MLSFYWVYQDATTGDFYLILHTSILNLLTNLYQLLLVSVAYSVSSKCSYTLPFLCWIYILFVFPFFFFWIHEGLVKCCNVHFLLEGRFFSRQMWKLSPIWDAFSIAYNLFIEEQHVSAKTCSCIFRSTAMSIAINPSRPCTWLSMTILNVRPDIILGP